VRKLDEVLTGTFQFSVIGGLWVGRIVVLFALCLVASGASMIPGSQLRVSCLIASVTSGLFGALLMLRLARVTEKCCAKSPQTESLFSALYAEMGSNVPAADASETFHFRVLQQYLADRQLGVRLFGVLITLDLVVLTALRSCVYLPAVVSTVSFVLQGSRSN